MIFQNTCYYVLRGILMNISCLEVPKEIEAVTSEVSGGILHLKKVQISANGYRDDHFATSYVLTRAINIVYDEDFRSTEGWFGHEKHCWLVWRKDGRIFDILPHGFLGGPIIADPNVRSISELYKEARVSQFGMIFDHCIRLVNDALTEYKNSLR